METQRHAEIPLGYIATNGVALQPSDSLGRAVELLEGSTTGVVPVMDGSVLRGLVSDREIAQGLVNAPDAPVSAVMTQSAPVVPAGMPAREGLRVLADVDFPALPVATPDGRFLGLVSRSELLRALHRRRRPAIIGGMATPLGVYLSDGVARGGVGDVALFLTGVFLFIGWTLSTAAAWGAGVFWMRAGLSPLVSAVWAQGLAFLVVFGLWFRLSWVAGFHAAEHQTVHAIERNEPLTPDRVAAMPRPHPRCGTNLVVFFAMFAGMVSVLKVNEVLAGLVCLLTFRFFGYWVQLHVTTRPASRAQVENGIRAGRQLLERYQEGTAPARFPVLRRVWNMGFAQVALGHFTGYLVALAVLWALSPSVPFVRGLYRLLQ